jgi:hypothetical protein
MTAIFLPPGQYPSIAITCGLICCVFALWIIFKKDKP